MSLESNTCWFATGLQLLNHTSKSRNSEKKPRVIFQHALTFQNITSSEDQQSFMHNVNITFLKLQRLCGLNTPAESFGLTFTSYEMPHHSSQSAQNFSNHLETESNVISLGLTYTRRGFSPQVKQTYTWNPVLQK